MHSNVTELERCGTSCRERREGRAETPCPEIQQGMCILGFNLQLAGAGSCPGTPGPIPAWERCSPAPSAPGPELGLTTWTMSREKIWMQHTTAESVQMMVEKMVKPQTLKRRSWGAVG